MEWSESKIKEYIADICHTQSVHLIDVDVSGGGKSRQVKITVDTEKGIMRRLITGDWKWRM